MRQSIQARGFTLVELVMVIMITGIIAASIALFLKPAIDSYFDMRRRADLTDLADTALRRMAQDISRAVPKSVRPVTTTCFQLVPVITAGRYRKDFDLVNDATGCTPSATCSAPLDTTKATTVFDVLTPIANAATFLVANNWVVIDNQSTEDVYNGSNRGQITAAAIPSRATDGLHRITISSTQFSPGYSACDPSDPNCDPGGRFRIVANAEQTVFYSCVGNVLYRTVAAFNADQATTCGLTTGAIVATDVADCEFDPTMNSDSFTWIRLELSRSGESIALVHGVQVMSNEQ